MSTTGHTVGRAYVNGCDMAFPCEGPNVPAYGLTKREWFAGLALQGVIASNGLNSPDDCAKYAQMAADSLLKCLAETEHRSRMRLRSVADHEAP